MRQIRTLLGAIAIGALLVIALVPGTPATAGPNALLDAANGHPSLSQGGKALPHPSSGAEVTFDDERALMSDAQASSDAPPDASISALGCANRGSATNPRVNQDCTLRRQAEEQVAVNPVDPNNVIAGQNDSRVGFNHCGFDYSLDGGATWGDGQPPFFQHISLAGHTYDAASDPAVTFDGTGRAWYSCVVFDVNTNASGLFVTRSTAGLKGSAYSNIGAGPSAFVVAEAVAGDHFFDKEFIAGDMRPGHTEVYVTFTDFQANPNCKKSFNRGGFCQSPIMLSKWVVPADPTKSHWTKPIQISGSSSLCVGGSTFNPQLPGNGCNFNQGSFPVVLPNGDVYVVFSNFNTPTLVNQQLGVRVKADLSVSAPVRVGRDDETNAALCDFGRGPEQCVDSLHIRSNDFPALALDPTNGSHLVAVWTDTRGATDNGAYRIIVSESADGGLTWSDSGGGGTVLTPSGAYFQPSVAVTSVGKVVVSTYRANTALHTTDPGDGTYGYGYFVKSGSGFGAYTPASDSQSMPSPEANAAQKGFLGDYSSIAAAPTGDTVYLVWSDTRNSNLQVINSEPVSVPDEDIFIKKVVNP